MRSQGCQRRFRSRHVDTLELVPTSYLPARGLVDSLDTRVDDPSTRRAVRRGDHFPLPGLVGDVVANLKLHRQDAAPGRRCWLALLPARTWPSHSTGPRERVDVTLAASLFARWDQHY